MKLIFTCILFSACLLALHPANAQWSSTIISNPRFHLSSISVGGKAYFAGGAMAGQAAATTIDIYDQVDGWSVENLAVGGAFIGIAEARGLIFFAGGLDINSGIESNVVEIYDTQTGNWDYAELSVPRATVMAIGLEDKVLFAGGATAGPFFSNPVGSNVIDIYDLNTGEWSTATLSEPKGWGSVVRAGNRVFFAGGLLDNNTMSKRIDIYDVQSGEWSMDSLSVARAAGTVATLGHQIFFAGGITLPGGETDVVDIYDTETDTWSVAHLSEPRATLASASACGQAFFAGGGLTDWESKIITATTNRVDIYSAETGEWSTGQLSVSRAGLTGTTLNGQVFFAGGIYLPPGLSNQVDVYTCEISAVDAAPSTPSFDIYPNPANTTATISISGQAGNPLEGYFELYNQLGEKVKTGQVRLYENRVGLNGLPPGAYYIKFVSTDGRQLGARKLMVGGYR